jgi:hypothetical protein
VQNLSPKLTNYFKSMIEKHEDENNEQLLGLALVTLHVLLENCPNAMVENLQGITEVRGLSNIRCLSDCIR